MSSIRYEFSDEELNNFKPKLLYLTQSEYGDDWHSTPHYHPFLELLYVFEGKGEFLIDGQAFSLRRGDFVIINPYTVHTETSTRSDPLKYYIFGIDNISLTADKKAPPPRSASLDGEESFCPVFHNPEFSERTLGYVQKIADEFEAKDPYYELMAYHRLCCLLIPILRTNNLAFSKPEKNKTATKEIIFVKQYIDKHFAYDLSLDDLAQKAFINKYHMIHFFTQAYGVSPMRYLNQRRIKEAKVLLRTTDLTVTAIANSVGFTSPSFFAKKFKELNDISPKDYRKSAAAALEEELFQ